jgi:hypothetical protein
MGGDRFKTDSLPKSAPEGTGAEVKGFVDYGVKKQLRVHPGPGLG